MHSCDYELYSWKTFHIVTQAHLQTFYRSRAQVRMVVSTKLVHRRLGKRSLSEGRSHEAGSRYDGCHRPVIGRHKTPELIQDPSPRCLRGNVTYAPHGGEAACKDIGWVPVEHPARRSAPSDLGITHGMTLIFDVIGQWRSSTVGSMAGIIAIK